MIDLWNWSGVVEQDHCNNANFCCFYSVAGSPTASASSSMDDHFNNLAVDDDAGNIQAQQLQQPLLKRTPTLSSSPFAVVGAKVSHIESLDYESVVH